MPEPSTGLREDLVGRVYRRLDGGGFGKTSTDRIRAVLHAAEIENIDEARIRSEAERETVQRIVAWLRGQRLPSVANAIEREFGSEDKGGEPGR